MVLFYTINNFDMLRFSTTKKESVKDRTLQGLINKSINQYKSKQSVNSSFQNMKYLIHIKISILCSVIIISYDIHCVEEYTD